MVEYTVKSIIADVMCIDQDAIGYNDGIITVIGADSLEMQSIVMNIEDALSITIDDNELYQNITVMDLIKLVERKRKEC